MQSGRAGVEEEQWDDRAQAGLCGQRLHNVPSGAAAIIRRGAAGASRRRSPPRRGSPARFQPRSLIALKHDADRATVPHLCHGTPADVAAAQLTALSVRVIHEDPLLAIAVLKLPVVPVVSLVRVRRRLAALVRVIVPEHHQGLSHR